MSYQGHTPTRLLHLQRHLKNAMEFKRTANGTPYFRHKGKDIFWTKRDNFTIKMRDVDNSLIEIKTDDFWYALELMR
jgi:hypothetical protein